MRMAQQMAQHEWRDWIELNIFGFTSLLCCWVFWCISWELRECIRVGVLGLCVFVWEREKQKERERDICCGPPTKLQVSAMATQKSLQKCHQFAVYGREREPKQKPKLRNKKENKGMNKYTQQILCTSSNEHQAIYVDHHLVVLLSHSCCWSCCKALILHWSSFILVVAFCFCSWDLVL